MAGFKAHSPVLEHHTFDEVRQMAAANFVVLIPAATVEQHGPHLPCDVDNLIVEYYCRQAAARQPDACTMAPVIPFGFNEHNMGFPGCIHIGEHTLIDMYADIARSFVRMGFRKILFVNGHGSNPPFLQIAARKVVNATEALVGVVSHWDLITDKIREIRESEFPGGCAHAGELETSLYLHICPERVDMSKISTHIANRWSKHVWVDLGGCGPVTVIDDWSRQSDVGIEGDPTKATAEKGKQWAEATIDRLLDFVGEFRALPIKPRRNYNFIPSDPGGPKA